MAETKVKQNQLDMTQIADADLSNLSGSAPVGLTNALAPLSNTVGYTVVGSPTITNGIVSGFSISGTTTPDDGLKISKQYLSTTLKNATFYCRFKTPAQFNSNAWEPIFYGNYPGGFGFSTYKGAAINFRLGTDVNDNILTIGDIDYNFSADTWYRAKMYGQDGIWKGELFSDDGTLLASVTADFSNVTQSLHETLYLCCCTKDLATNVSGSIDLNNTYIKVNGEYWFVGRWQEINPVHLAAMSDTVVQITRGNSEDNYTMPADGELSLFADALSSGGAWFALCNNGENSTSSKVMAFTSAASQLISLRLLVKKNDIVKVGWFGTTTFSKEGFTNLGLFFRYATGNESEASN